MVSQSTPGQLAKIIKGGLPDLVMSRSADERSIDHIQRGLTQLKKQREVCDRADAMYDGDVGLTFASFKVRRLLAKQGGLEEIDDFNYARIPVDVIANRLQIAAVKVAPAEENADDQTTKENAAVTAAEKAIARLRKRNELDAEEKRLHTDVSKHGEAFVLVWPVTDDGGKVIDVDMRVNSAHNVAMVYDEEDSLRPDFVIKSWTVDVKRKTVVRANLYYFGEKDGRVERWMTEPGGNPDDEKAWLRVAKIADVSDVESEDMVDVAEDEFTEEDDDGESLLDVNDIPNPWGQVWFHFRNGRPCGRPEHASAYGPQTLINKLIYAHAGTIDYQSFPQRYLLQDPAIDDPMVNSEDPDHPDDEEDDPETETGSAGLKADPATVWKLWGRSVGEFAAADPQMFLAPLDRYIKSMAELTDIPQYAFSKASGDLPSGSAVRQLNGAMNAKVKDRQDRYDPQWQDGYEKALTMLGISGVTVDVRWEPPELINDLDGWQMLKAKQDAGVPGSVTLEEAGYAPELVEEWGQDLANASIIQRVEMLEKIATAAQALGAAVVTGSIADTTSQALFERLLRLTVEGTEDIEDADSVDPLPVAEFRDPPPVNPAMAQAEAAGANPLTQAQIEATKASAETSRASARMLNAGGGSPADGRQPPRKTAGRRPAGRP